MVLHLFSKSVDSKSTTVMCDSYSSNQQKRLHISLSFEGDAKVVFVLCCKVSLGISSWFDIDTYLQYIQMAKR